MVVVCGGGANEEVGRGPELGPFALARLLLTSSGCLFFDYYYYSLLRYLDLVMVTGV